MYNVLHVRAPRNPLRIGEGEDRFVEPSVDQPARGGLLQFPRDQGERLRSDPEMHFGQDVVVLKDDHLVDRTDGQLGQRPPPSSQA